MAVDKSSTAKSVAEKYGRFDATVRAKITKISEFMKRNNYTV